MCIAKQKEAIKNCLKKLGYNSVRVTMKRVNPHDRTLKTFKVEYAFKVMSRACTNSINLLVDNSGIISISTNGADWQRVLLFEINALSKALRDEK